MASIFSQAILQVDHEWLEFMESHGFAIEARGILERLEVGYARDHTDSLFADVMCPRAENVFAFAHECPFDEVRVVLVGQDPYPKRECAEGRSFSVPVGVAIPPSLRNIYAALVAQGLMPASDATKTGNLVKWSRQGVVLINTALTTLAGTTAAHMDAWAAFTRRVIIEIGRAHPGTIYILLGDHAQKLKRDVPKNCAILEWSHPSPMCSANRDAMNPKHFSKCTVFKVANNMLIANGKEPIDWNPNGPIASSAPAAAAAAGIGAAAPMIAGKVTREVITRDHALAIPDMFGDVIVAFVDGAAAKNGSEDATAAWGAIIVCGDVMYTIQGIVETITEHGGKKLVPTNNRAELMAMRDVFALVASEAFISAHGTRALLVAYDSAYAAGCIREWYEKWCKVPPREVKLNLDIIKIAYDYKKRCEAARTIEWEHVKSHRVEPKDPRARYLWLGNARVDELAQVGARQ
jgi:uracil-DNA glycosylase